MKLGDIGLQFHDILAQARKVLSPVLRHHVTIAIIIVAGLLMYAVITVDQILNAPSDQDYLREHSKGSINTRFDDDTIQRIEQLRNREQNPNLRLPGGRISPFIE